MTKQEIFEMCRSIDFPQTTLNDVSLITNFNNLKNAYAFGNSCTQLLQHFHPSIWKANIKNHLSPFEAWYDDTCLMKSIDNRLRYKGENLSPRDIRSGFSIAKIAPKVSMFRPALARYIIKIYLDEFDEIFDPCSGYSGRLLGAMSLNKKYIGQDINPVTVKESNNLINYFKFFDLNKCEVSCKNSICTKGKYECLFTCPPYSDKENWNQSIENLSCDEWIDLCLKNYKCKKYVFVVDKTEKYKNYIVDKIPNSSHLNTNYEYIILIDKR